MPSGARPTGVTGWIAAQSSAAKAAAALAVALAAVVVAQHVAAGQDAVRRADRDLAVSRQAEYMTTMLLEQRRYEKDSIINVADPVQSESYARQWDLARMAALGSVDALGSLDLTNEDRASLGVIRADLQQYIQGYQRLLAQIRSGQVHTPEEANRLLESAKPAAHRAEANGMLLATRALGRLRMR
jgi:methyl-accepting chemotaxis protein